MCMRYVQFDEKRLNHGINKGGVERDKPRRSCEVDNCESGRDMAANSKRLMEVMAELEAMPDPKEKKVSKHDRLKSKNENR